MGLFDNLKSRQALVAEVEKLRKENAEKDSKLEEQNRLIKDFEQIRTDIGNKVYTAAELQKMISENRELKKLQEFREKIQEIYNIIVDLEISIKRLVVGDYNINNSTNPTNNVLFFLMQLQTLLNLLYCSVSNCDNLDNLINNLKQMKVLNNEKVQTLIVKLKEINLDDDILLKINSWNKPLTHEAYQRVFNVFNRDFDNFPSPFYYGIGNDMVAK